MNKVTEATNLVHSLFSRIAWAQQCKPLMAMHEVRTRLGVEKTVASIIAGFDTEAKAQTFIDLYKGYYLDALVAGDRTVRIFSLEEEEVEQVLAAVADVAPIEGVDTRFFPYYIDEENIDALGKAAKLTHIKTQGDKTYFFFSSNRKITEKRDLDPNVFGDNEAIVQFLSDFSKVTGFSEKSRQYIDIVCLNSSDNTLELRLDTSSAVASKDINLLFRDVQEAFVGLFNPRLEFPVFTNSVNFFPLIETLYGDDDCRVVELSFTSDDGFIHHERDRKATNSSDVRTGEFHKGGIEKCDITPYRISARWKGEFTLEAKYEYEMSLNSSVRELSRDGGGQLDYAIVSMCPSESNLESLLSVLKS